MKRCKETGKFKPHPIKVGDMAVNLRQTFNPGFTYMKAYKVVATSLSKDKSGLNNFILIRDPEHFIVIDDNGDRRFCSLNKSGLMHWEKLPK